MYKLMALAICSYLILSTHPMTTLITILMSSMVVSKTLFDSTQSQWLVYILILTFISGLMILFSYVVTLVPNENTASSKMKTIPIILLLALISQNIEMSNSPKEEAMKTFYSNGNSSLMLIVLAIFLMLGMSMKMIFDPFKPMKSMH